MAQPTVGVTARLEAEKKGAEEGDARPDGADVGVDAEGTPAGVEARTEGPPESVDARAEGTPGAAHGNGVPEVIGAWNDPDLFGDLRPPAQSSEMPATFRPVTRLGGAVAEGEGEVPIDTSRFLKRANPWARGGVGVAVAIVLGMLGFAIARGPIHTAAEEVVLASPGPHHGPTDALLGASLDIGKACGSGRATSPATVRVTFLPEGGVQNVVVTSAHAGTPMGDCVAAKVREVRSKPFDGPPSTITEQISLSPSP